LPLVSAGEGAGRAMEFSKVRQDVEASLRHLKRVSPYSVPRTSLRSSCGWSPKAFVDNIVDNFIDRRELRGLRHRRFLNAHERRLALSLLPWLRPHVRSIVERRRRIKAAVQGRRPSLRPSYQRAACKAPKEHSIWKDEVQARVTSTILGVLEGGCGNVLVLDDFVGKRGRGRELRSCESFRAHDRGRLTLYVPNPNASVLNVASEKYGAEIYQGFLSEALDGGPWSDLHFAGAYLDFCHGSVEKVLRDLRLLMHRLSDNCAVAVTITGRDAAGGSLGCRSVKIFSFLEENGFYAPSVKEAMMYSEKKAVHTMIALRTTK
jgi:hypothetical protein